MHGALGARLGDVRSQPWGHVEELLAALVEVVDAGNRLLFRVNTKRGVQQPKPIKVPRPSGVSGETGDVDTPKRKRPATSAELADFFGGAVRYTGPGAGDSVTPTSPEVE